jgi:hypothetical protein
LAFRERGLTNNGTASRCFGKRGALHFVAFNVNKLALLRDSELTLKIGAN